MGLTNSTSGAIFLSVFGGKITRRVEKGTAGATERENKEGKLVYELTYSILSGKLTDIEFRDGNFGREIIFVVKDDENVYRLQQQYSSRIAKSIITRLPKCNLSENIEIHTGLDKEKETTFAYIVQDGKVVKSAYTKDEPNGMPSMEQKKIKGKEVWDDTLQLEFLEKMLNKDIIPKLKKSSETIIADQPDILGEKQAQTSEEGDDLPF